MPAISSVSGNAVHGQSLTIFGSDFGTKSPATPHWWDDFEGHTLSANVNGLTPVNGPTNWSAGSIGAGPNHAPTIANSNLRHARATKCALLDNDPTEGNWSIAVSASITPLGSGSKLYIFFRNRMSKNGSYSDNYKPYEYFGEVGVGFSGFGDPVADPNIRTDNTYTDAGGGSNLNYGGIDQTDILDTWVGYEEEIGLQSSGGSRRLWVHIGTSDIHAAWNDQSMTKTIDGGEHVDFIVMGNYHRDSYNYIFRIADTYIDNTFARVMIGDASTWTACNAKEIFIPTAWSDTQITATVRLGVMPDGVTRWLYAVKSDGSVNATGFAVTTGASGEGGGPIPSVSPRTIYLMP
jgi:hypothetical protein